MTDSADPARRDRPFPSRSWVSTGTHLLIESGDRNIAEADRSILSAEGFEVALCFGPCTARGILCPLAEGQECPLVRDADAILCLYSFARGPDFTAHVAKLRERYGDVPVCVEVPLPYVKRYEAALAGCTVLHAPVTPYRFMRAVSGRRKRVSVP